MASLPRRSSNERQRSKGPPSGADGGASPHSWNDEHARMCGRGATQNARRRAAPTVVAERSRARSEERVAKRQASDPERRAP